MSPTDVYAIHVELIGILNSIFEIWLGFTFAAIVAFHFAAPTMHRIILGTTLVLYLLASYVFATRYFHTQEVVGFMNQALQDANIQPYPAPGGEIVLFLVTIFTLGSVSTVVYAIVRYRNGKHDNA